MSKVMEITSAVGTVLAAVAAGIAAFIAYRQYVVARDVEVYKQQVTAVYAINSELVKMVYFVEVAASAPLSEYPLAATNSARQEEMAREESTGVAAQNSFNEDFPKLLVDPTRSKDKNLAIRIEALVSQTMTLARQDSWNLHTGHRDVVEDRRKKEALKGELPLATMNRELERARTQFFDCARPLIAAGFPFPDDAFEQCPSGNAQKQ